MMDNLSKVESSLADPKSEGSLQPDYCKNNSRSKDNSEVLVWRVCTHLGCAPGYRPDVGAADLGGSSWVGRFYALSRAPKYDLAGRFLAVNLRLVICQFLNISVYQRYYLNGRGVQRNLCIGWMRASSDRNLWIPYVKVLRTKEFQPLVPFGVLSMVVVVNQLVTGIWLTMMFNPSAEGAFASVEYIMRDVQGGWLFVIYALNWRFGILRGRVSAYVPWFVVWFIPKTPWTCLAHWYVVSSVLNGRRFRLLITLG